MELFDHKNARFDSLKRFSASYLIIWDDLRGKFDGIATCVQLKGSCRQKIKKKL